jgi:O-antigen ligase
MLDKVTMTSLSLRLIRPTTWLGGKSLRMVLLVSSLLIAVFSAAMYLNVEPFQILAAVMLIGAALVTVTKFPLVLVGALPFVGILKTKAAEGVNLSDPTFIALALTTASILARLLSVPRTERVSIRQLFAGQGNGLALYLLFLCVLTGSYLYAPSTFYGMDKVLRMWTINLILFFSPLFLVKNEKDFRTLIKVFMILSFVLAALTVEGLFVHTEQDRGEARTRIGEAWYIGAAILVFLFHRFQGRFGRTAAVLGIPLLTIGLAASLARGPLLSLLMVLLLSLAVVRWTSAQVSKKMICFGVLTALSVGAGVLLLIQHLPSVARTFSLKESELAAFSLSENPGGTAGMRLAYYKAALEGFEERPFLGWGTGAWPIYYWHEDKRSYPHNIFLETAFEQGLVGLISLLALIGAVFRRLFRFLGTGDGRFAFLFPVVLFSLAVTCFSGDITAKALWFWFGTVFAAARITQSSMAYTDRCGRRASASELSYYPLPGR